jgi:hypothetical protein
MRLSIGNGGWVALDGLDLPGPLYLRMRAQGDRLRIAEFYLDASAGPEAIDATDLQGLPFRQLEAFLNSCREDIELRAASESPDVSTLASYYATTFGTKARQVAEGNWVVASFVARFLPKVGDRAVVRSGGPGQSQLLTEPEASEALAADPTLGRVMRVGRAPKPKGWQGLRESEREFRLTSGPTAGLTDDFLHDVGRAYNAAILRGERPNVAIKEQTGYPLKTVQRWVFTARQRRIMTPADKKGRAG